MDCVKDDTALVTVVDIVLDFIAEGHVATGTHPNIDVSIHRRLLFKGSISCRRVCTLLMHSHCFMICICIVDVEAMSRTHTSGNAE